MTWIVLATLLLQPSLDAPGTLRMVADGTGDEPVEWRVEGAVVAVTASGEATALELPAGRHDVWAESKATGPWRALARPEPSPGEGAAFVPAWMAVHEPDHAGPRVPAAMMPALLGALALLLLGWPRRSKSPSRPEDSPARED